MDMIDMEASSAFGLPGSPNEWSNVVPRSIEYITDFPVNVNFLFAIASSPVLNRHCIIII